MQDHPLIQFDYPISEANIGKQPAEPRDEAKLFVYNTKTDEIFIDKFYNLSNYLPENSLMVMNNTGVIPARLMFTKDTGGKVEGLILLNEGIQPDGTIATIVNKKVIPGRVLMIENYEFEIVRQNHQYFYLKPKFDIELLPELLVKYGTTPIPKYLGNVNMDEEKLRDRYQTIYAGEKKSVAAPTASLHFTERVFESLNQKNVERSEVTLHVGMGTFAEVSEENIKERKLHTEPISISKTSIDKIRQAKENKKEIIAVGTTAIRTLESQAEILFDKDYEENILTSTNLFILPPHEFKIADILITNFHVPKSSLMALVQAFLEYKKSKRDLVELYKLALEKDFKFYSFGDSMLIL
jgi:S-adenosylmethionine:tRNA ribosyltransferase-isomerase